MPFYRMQKDQFVTFPVDDAKRPAIKKWQLLTKSSRSRAKYGIVCGQINNLTVVDIDTDGLAKWNKLIQEHGEIDTPKVVTPSGGFHYYFNFNKDIKNWVKTEDAGIDTRSEGGYVVGFSSTGYNLINDVPRIDIPDWLEEFLTRPRTKTPEPEPVVIDSNKINLALELWAKVPDSVNHSGIKSQNTTQFRTKIFLTRIHSSHCDICNRSHDNDNTAFLVAYENGCVKRGCARSTIMINLTEAVTQAYSKHFLKNAIEYSERFCSNYEPLIKSNANILCSRAQMGTGKTNAAAIRLLNVDKNGKIIIVSFRISLSEVNLNDKFKAIPNLQSYKKVDKIDGNVKRIIIQPESMYKINWNLSKESVSEMVIDEVSQVRQQFTSSTFLKQAHASDSWAKFKMLVRNTKTIHIMDANLTYLDINWIKNIRQSSSDLVHVFDNKFLNLKDRDLVIYDNHLTIINDISDNLKENKRVYLACNGATEKIDAYTKILKAEHPDAKILTVHRDTMSNPDVKQALANPNMEFNKFDLIITSPSIQSGLSYDNPDFDSVYGIFGNYTSGTNDCGQMLQRIRHPKNKIIKVALATGNQKIGALTRDELINYTLNSNSHIQTGLKELLDKNDYEYNAENMKVLTENDFTKLWVDNSIERNWDLTLFKSNFMKLHERMGVTVSESEDDITFELSQKYSKMLKIARNELKSKNATEIANALELTSKEIKEIKDKLDKGKSVTSEEMLSIQKMKISEVYEVDPNQEPSWYEKYQDTQMIKHFKNQRILASNDSFDQALAAVKASEIANVKYGEDLMQDPEKDYTANEKEMNSVLALVKRHPKYARWAILTGWIKTLGFPTFDSDVEYSAEVITESCKTIQLELFGQIDWISSILEKKPGVIDTVATIPIDDGYLKHMLKFINGGIDTEFGLKIKQSKNHSNMYSLHNRHAGDFRVDPTDPGLLPCLKHSIIEDTLTSDGELI